MITGHQQGAVGTDSQSFQAQRGPPAAQPGVLSRKEGPEHWGEIEVSPPPGRATENSLPRGLC